MKRNFWRKTAAFTLALTLATGSLPANAPLQDLFSGAVMTAYAEVIASGECGENVTWTLENGKLTISGSGAMKDYDEEGPWQDQASDITQVEIGDGVTTIGQTAFFQLTCMTSVTIPDSVTSIGDYAFYGCTSLTSVTIPESVTNIGVDAFAWCSSLTSFTIPDGVTSIDEGVFYCCRKLASVTIPYSVTSIGDDTFYGCNLKSVTIPDSVTSIGDYAFSNCTNLTEITIPDSVTSIGMDAFHGTPWLDAKRKENPLVVVNGILIDGKTCSGAVKIPDSVTSIGDYAFYECNSLTEITIPNSVTSIGDYAFTRCTSLTSITIPDSVTSIGSAAFESCSSLTSVTIPDSVTNIGESAFDGCSSLTSVTIPDSVTNIGESAFDGCSSLTSVTIPDSVTSLGYAVFCNCTSLKSVIVERTETLTALDEYAFIFWDDEAGPGGILPNVTIYVPATKTEEYKNAENWSDYAERIIGYSDTQLPDGKYKQTAQKDGTYYTRFVFVVPKTDFANKSKALFTATYNGTDYTYETSTYYTGVISNGVTYNPASSSDRAMFVVTVTSGSDISDDLTCKLDFE